MNDLPYSLRFISKLFSFKRAVFRLLLDLVIQLSLYFLLFFFLHFVETLLTFQYYIELSSHCARVDNCKQQYIVLIIHYLNAILYIIIIISCVWNSLLRFLFYDIQRRKMNLLNSIFFHPKIMSQNAHLN